MKSIVTGCPSAGKKPRVQALRCGSAAAPLRLRCILLRPRLHPPALPLRYARHWRPQLPQATVSQVISNLQVKLEIG